MNSNYIVSTGETSTTNISNERSTIDRSPVPSVGEPSEVTEVSVSENSEQKISDEDIPLTSGQGNYPHDKLE